MSLKHTTARQDVAIERLQQGTADVDDCEAIVDALIALDGMVTARDEQIEQLVEQRSSHESEIETLKQKLERIQQILLTR